MDGGRRNMYDPDEIEEEQRERERRNKINAEFQGFVKRVQVRAFAMHAMRWGFRQARVHVGGRGGVPCVGQSVGAHAPRTPANRPPCAP